MLFSKFLSSHLLSLTQYAKLPLRRAQIEGQRGRWVGRQHRGKVEAKAVPPRRPPKWAQFSSFWIHVRFLNCNSIDDSQHSSTGLLRKIKPYITCHHLNFQGSFLQKSDSRKTMKISEIKEHFSRTAGKEDAQHFELLKATTLHKQKISVLQLRFKLSVGCL